MLGSPAKGDNARETSLRSLLRVLVAAVPVTLSVVSLLGLRGLDGHFLSPAASLVLAVAALSTATAWRPQSGSGLEPLREIGLALAIAALSAAAMAALITGHV
jgi:hypothetical protein